MKNIIAHFEERTLSPSSACHSQGCCLEPSSPNTSCLVSSINLHVMSHEAMGQQWSWCMSSSSQSRVCRLDFCRTSLSFDCKTVLTYSEVVMPSTELSHDKSWFSVLSCKSHEDNAAHPPTRPIRCMQQPALLQLPVSRAGSSPSFTWLLCELWRMWTSSAEREQFWLWCSGLLYTEPVCWRRYPLGARASVRGKLPEEPVAT